MGYYTRYRLMLTPYDEAAEATVRRIEWEGGPLVRDGFVEAKWYDHEEDMRRVSAQYPDVLFTLMGEGEDAEDLWAKHFKGGGMQVVKAVVTFEEFDPSKLR